jgi:hypothetical protein
MSQQLKVIMVFGLIELAALTVARLNDALVPLAGLIMVIGVVALIVWIRRQYRRERPKPPWPPSGQDPSSRGPSS